MSLKKPLSETHPEVAAQWHPSKNGNLTPDEVTFGSGRKVWWICPRGHEWKTTVATRTRGSGCPHCNIKTSRLEIAVYCEIKGIFADTEWRKKFGSIECDVFIPSIMAGIELDGVYWHKGKEAHDREKNKKLKAIGINLLRLRGYGLEKLSPQDIILPKRAKYFNTVKVVFTWIEENFELTGNTRTAIKDYLHGGSFRARNEYRRILSRLPAPEYEDSLEALAPTVASEWHATRNAPLTPDIFSSKSGYIVWWKCKVKGHEWRASIANRVNGTDCPFCAGKRIGDDNNLAVLFPEVAKQWHVEKNQPDIPLMTSPWAHKKVWWTCDKGHTYKMQVKHRVYGSGCPYCAGKLPSDDNNLAAMAPDLARSWHPKKNGLLRPEQVTPGSGKRVWWICEKGHEWRTSINHRVNGSGCPYCSGKLVCDDNSLSTHFPDLATEWHPTKNGELGSDQVTPSSHRKVWWKCDKGHEWLASIGKRSSGQGCPFCAKHQPKVTPETCLSASKPYLLVEWHPTKNLDLRPDDLRPGSGKLVWWKCQRGHQWQARVINRSKGQGCPYCAGKKVGSDNNLAVIHPELASEWHPQENGDLTPNQVRPQSHKKVWWKCKKGHEWQAKIQSRFQGSGCPYCSNKRVGYGNSVADLLPELAKEWHINRNGKLTPDQVTPGSHKKVWWRCSRGHEWQATICSRSRGLGCPYCSNKMVCEDNNLASTYPIVTAEWYSAKNGKLTPFDVVPGSGKVVWWICSEGHTWKAEIRARAIRGSGCPYCTGRKK